MSEKNSNFHQLLELRAQENLEIIEWLRKRNDKYTSPEIQNESNGSATFLPSWLTKQQMFLTRNNWLFGFRWVDDSFVIHQDLIGMYPLERTTADQVVAILKNALLRMN